MKLPSLQWYPSDWLRDPAVSALPRFTRSVWFDLLMHMHACDPRGKLVLNGAAIPEEALANMLGLDNQTLTTCLKQILTFGVAEVEPQTGIIFNRRMVRDEELRQIRAKAGKMGGNPRLLNQIPTTGVKQKTTPSSSSSSSSSKEKKPHTPLEPQPDLTDAFDELWNAYPVKGRSKRVACEGYFVEILEGLRGEALERRIAAIRKPVEPGGVWHRSAKWSKGFIQGLDTYLKQRMWDEQPPSAEAEKSETVSRYEDCDNPQSINYGMNEIGYYKGRDAK